MHIELSDLFVYHIIMISWSGSPGRGTTLRNGFLTSPKAARGQKVESWLCENGSKGNKTRSKSSSTTTTTTYSKEHSFVPVSPFGFVIESGTLGGVETRAQNSIGNYWMLLAGWRGRTTYGTEFFRSTLRVLSLLSRFSSLRKKWWICSETGQRRLLSLFFGVWHFIALKQGHKFDGNKRRWVSTWQTN